MTIPIFLSDMHTIGTYAGTVYSPEGACLISFAVEDTTVQEELAKTGDKRLVIDAQVFREARSKRANRYVWQLLDKMAKVLGTRKETLYKLEISRYGVFTDMEVIQEAIPILERYFRVVERFDDGYEERHTVTVRCYYGSSKYNSKEMSDFINGVVNDAKEIGVETATYDEIAAMVAAWKGGTDE